MASSKIGRYEIKFELGRGGMASVYRAHDPGFDRDVAVKVLPRELLHDPSFRARFEREARMIAALEHPAIVPVYDYGEEDGQPYIVMRLMGGGSLADQLRTGALPLPEAARILSALAPALDRAHTKGIIHRDLKPSNILFDEDGNPYLADFGIARLTSASTVMTATGLMGTPAYMSPEQARGEKDLDARSDLYALGVIVFQMLTGQLPYDADTPIGLAMMHVTAPLPRIRAVRPDLPPKTDALIRRAMAKGREARYQNAASLASELATMPATSRVATPKLLRFRLPRTAPKTALASTKSVAPPATTVPDSAAVATKQAGTPGSAGQPWTMLQKRSALLVAGGLVVLGIVSVGAVILVLLWAVGGRPTAAIRLTPTAKPRQTVVSPTPNSTQTGLPALAAPRDTLFTSTRDGKAEIYRMDTKGQVFRVIYSPGSSESWGPKIAPNGDILFTSTQNGKAEIYRMNTLGQVFRVIYSSGSSESWGPTIAPDGDILFTSTQDGKAEIYRMNTQGQVFRVTYSSGRGQSWGPTFVPNGDILFTSTRDGKAEIYRMNTQGQVFRVTYSSGSSESWGPATATEEDILFTSTRDGKAEIYRMNTQGQVFRVTYSSGSAESWITSRLDAGKGLSNADQAPLG